ncbi:uncharacterized protein LOC132747568 [Ruditapes philippinarum]|uniref:uncharacterized protein LOC132747568 n=1 Tax=Ruditapes philippinarum TaxID=129788 RepID=UPI00295A8997|nr:uncharacterized protein LOC132747568 [Ruditapes philippinarum]
MAGEFTPFDSDKTGSDIQPKILRSGLFSVAQYVDHPMLFFKCDIAKYCISASDTDCTTAICDGGRKRRQVNSENSVDNITTSTWVFPYDISPSKPTITETVQDPSSFKTCLDNTYVQISYILLLILMLISFFTALCFCCLFKRNSRREKEIDKNFYKQRTRPTF